MSYQTIEETLQPWFDVKESWHDYIYPIAKRRLILLVPHDELSSTGCREILKRWGHQASETLIVAIKTGESAMHYIPADEKAGEVEKNLSKYPDLDTLQMGSSLRVYELAVLDQSLLQSRLEASLENELDSQSIVVAPEYYGARSEFRSVTRAVESLSLRVGFEFHFYSASLSDVDPCLGTYSVPHQIH